MGIDFPQKYSLLTLKISTVWEWLLDVAHRTVAHSSQVDVGSETELQINVQELIFDDVYLSKVVDDKKSWFTPMDLIELIYHQCYFTTNSLGCQPMTSQYF